MNFYLMDNDIKME